MSEEDLTKPTKELSREQLSKRHTVLVEYIKAHPTASYRQFQTDTHLQIANPTYFTTRKKLTRKNLVEVPRANPIKEIKTVHARAAKIEKLKEFIRANPDATYSDFLKEGPKIKVSKSAYTYHCRKLCGLRRIKAATGKAGRIYKTLWSRSTLKMTNQTREVVDEIVGVLNDGGNTSWQVVEMTRPPLLEIRELGR